MSQCCNTQPVCKHYMFTFHDVAQNRHLLTCLLTCNRSLNVAVISEEEKRKSKCCSSTTFWPSSFVSTRRKVSASNDRNFKRQSIGDTPRYSTIRTTTTQHDAVNQSHQPMKLLLLSLYNAQGLIIIETQSGPDSFQFFCTFVISAPTSMPHHLSIHYLFVFIFSLH